MPTEPLNSQIRIPEIPVRATATSWAAGGRLAVGWRSAGEEYQGNLVEITADRVTHKFASRGEIAFELKVTGNAFTGTASAVFFDATGRRIKGPIRVQMEGDRVQP
jgi:hypothetical protein